MYRAGRYEAAVKRLAELKLPAKRAPFDAIGFAVLAMAQQRLGRTEEAQTSLTAARALVREKMPDPDNGRLFGQDGWNDWLHAQILFQEAEELLGKK